MTDTQQKIKELTGNLCNFLIEKNKRYGDSALHPRKVFCKEDGIVQLTARLDDKLTRLENSKELRKNDLIDLVGYIILLCIAKNWTNFDEFLD